jgi:hypothetical protein
MRRNLRRLIATSIIMAAGLPLGLIGTAAYAGTGLGCSGPRPPRTGRTAGCAGSRCTSSRRKARHGITRISPGN